MSEPKFPLGVTLMDEEHARLEAVLSAAATARDADLLNALTECRTEIAAHFQSEEALMAKARVPVLACHIAQHRRLVEDIDAMLDKQPVDPSGLREYLARDLPNMVMAHIASVDQLSARFLTGNLPDTMTSGLRLPEGTAS